MARDQADTNRIRKKIADLESIRSEQIKKLGLKADTTSLDNEIQGLYDSLKG